jgi:hypothetical protein
MSFGSDQCGDWKVRIGNFMDWKLWGLEISRLEISWIGSRADWKFQERKFYGLEVQGLEIPGY